jgi:osmotically-inducible protein OsmY
MSNDLLIRQSVAAALDSKLGLTADEIGVEVHHGFVKLAGQVSTKADRLNAERVAKKVPGVTEVLLDIDVQPSIRSLRRVAHI